MGTSDFIICLVLCVVASVFAYMGMWFAVIFAAMLFFLMLINIEIHYRGFPAPVFIVGMAQMKDQVDDEVKEEEHE